MSPVPPDGKEAFRLISLILLWGILLGICVFGITQALAEAKPSLAVLPFIVERGTDPGRGVYCPICKNIYRSGEILPGSQNRLTRILHQKIEALERFKVSPMEKMEGALSHRDKRQLEERLIPSAIQLGKELDMDFIFVGVVFRFEERIGSHIGAERPASLAFDIHLFRVKDGREVWRGKIDETQKPLSENLFQIGSFIRRKASWLTADELASVGMDEILKPLPGPKELEEK